MSPAANALPAAALERLHRQFEPVLAMAEAAPAALLTQRPEPGKWSVHENLAHLGRYQEVFLARVAQIAQAAEPPAFARYVADDDPGFAEWARCAPAAVRADLRRGRQALVAALQALDSAELGRTAHHPVYGRLNVAGWTEFFLLHEAHHLLTVLRLLGPAQPL